MTIRLLPLAALATTTLVLSPASAAGPTSVTGVWQVYSDKDGSADGRVRTFIQDGKLTGVVDELRPDAPGDSKCTKCSGAQKDQPIKGLVIMWGFAKEGDSWTGGRILEPHSGSIYRCTVKFVAPNVLEVRGYVGLSLFGRTQTWKRAHE